MLVKFCDLFMSASWIPARVSLLAAVFLFGLPNNLPFGVILASWSLVSFHCTFLISAWHLSLRVDITSEAVYELVAETIQEPQAGEPQAEAAVEPDPEVANPADWQGKPGA